MPLSAFTPQVREWFEGAFEEPTRRPGAGLAGDRHRRARADLARRPARARRSPRSCGRSTGSCAEPTARPHAARLRLAAEGALLRRRAQPARAAARDRRRRQGRDPHRRHAAAGARGDAPPPAGHPHHDARVAVPDAHRAGARDLRRRRGGDRRRDPRRRRRPSAARTSRSRSSGSPSAGRARRRSGSACRATQNPLEEVGRFLVGPQRTCTIVDAGVRKPLDLQDPRAGRVDGRAGAGADVELDPFERTGQRGDAQVDLAGDLPGAARARPASTARRSSSSTTAAAPSGSRCGSTSCARGATIARAHHGSLAREERLVVEELLKAGELPCLVATSSLELGIDMGAVDLVLQVESPKSVAARAAAHRPRRPQRRRHLQGPHLPEVPRRPARVRGRRPAACARGRSSRPSCRATRSTCSPSRSSRSPRPPATTSRSRVDDLLRARHAHALLRRAVAPAARERARHARRPLPVARSSASCAPRIVWDRVGGHDPRRARARARSAITNAGTIPDRGLFSRRPARRPPRRRARRGDGLRGAARPDVPARRVDAGGSRRSAATASSSRPRRACPAPCRSGRATASGGPKELGEAIGAFARWAVDQDAETLERDYDLDALAAEQPARLPARAAGRDARRPERPHDRRRALPRRDRRLAAVRPLALRRARPRRLGARAERADPRASYGLESDAIWSDDGIIVHLPDADEPPGAELVLVEPDELEDAVVGELGGSALFGARFRENAGRALLIPRAYPGRRTPLWQQRLKSQSLLEVAKRYAEFPIILETYRECLRDVLDVPGLQELLRELHSRELSLVEVETPTASPFASSLLFDYVATYMYEGDTPNAERRAAALSLDRDLLRELLGQEELRELIDPGALEQVEADLQHRSERTRADDARRAARRAAPRRRPDRSTRRATARRGRDADALARAARRASAAPSRLRVGGEERWIAADDAGPVPRRARRGAAGRAARGVPRGRARRAGASSCAATRARTARSRPRELRDALRRRPRRRARRRSSAPASSSAASCGPAAREREWCDPEVLRRLRRASLAALRKEIEPADQRALARVPAVLAGRRPPPAAGRRDRPPARGARPAAGPRAARRRVGARRAAAPRRRLLADVARPAVRLRRGRLGRRRRARPPLRPRRALLPRGRRRCSAPPPGAAARAGGAASTTRCASACAPAPCFFTDLLADVAGVAARGAQEALWDLVWAGEVTNDAFAPLRAPRLTLAAPRSQQARAERAPPLRRPPPRRAAAGPGPLVADRRRCSAGEPIPRRAAARRPSCCSSATGSSPASRCSPRASPAASRRSTTRSPRSRRSASARRGYFVEGLGGAQFALPGAVERLRAQRDDDERAAARARRDRPGPALRRGAAVAASATRAARPPRIAGAYVVLAGAEPVLYVERGGKGLQVLVADDDPRVAPALEALADASQRGRVRQARARARRRRAGRRLAAARRCWSSSASAPARASSRLRRSRSSSNRQCLPGCRGRHHPLRREPDPAGARGPGPGRDRHPAPALPAATAGRSGSAAGRCARSTPTASTCSCASRASS